MTIGTDKLTKGVQSQLSKNHYFTEALRSLKKDKRIHPFAKLDADELRRSEKTKEVKKNQDKRNERRITVSRRLANKLKLAGMKHPLNIKEIDNLKSELEKVNLNIK